MGRRIIVMCAALFACLCAPADARLIYSADGRLYEIDADGSNRTLFTAPTSLQASDSDPTWSPDGTRLAVVHEGDPNDLVTRSRIDLLSRDGSSRRRIIPVDRDMLVGSPRWSPDGAQLAFLRATESSHNHFMSSIVVTDLDGNERTLVRQRLDRHLSSVATPEWAPDGKAILYGAFRLGRSSNFHSSIRVAPLDGGPTQLVMRDAHSPVFSPDGSRIAFISTADQNGQTCGSDECSYNGELYVMDADGSNAQRLTRNEGDDMAPEWAPDGSRIAFNSDRNFSGAQELYSIEPDGDCLTWLTNGTAVSVDPAWRPDTVSTDPGGCGATRRPALIEVDLAPARTVRSARPQWLGRTWRGLLLSYAERVGHGVQLGYYDCAFYRPAACRRGVSVITQPVCSPLSGVDVLRGPAERRRNALVQRFGRYAFMVLTGGATIQVFPQAATVFRALRPFPRETTGKKQLRPPSIPAGFARELERVVRLRDRLGSIREVAHRMDLDRWQVRQRLATAKTFEAYGHPVHKKRC